MENRELAAIIENEVSSSIGQWNGELSDDRATELDYYNSEPFGNEVEGESQVVSSDVFDTVEGMLPSLLRIFTASDDVVRFEPNGPEDEAAAAQRTEVCNYVFYRQNNGFLVMYEWFKDALIQKNGIVKYWWDERKTKSEEEYKGLSEAQYIKLVSGEGYGSAEVEVLEHSEYPDEAEISRRQEQKAKAIEGLAAQQIPPQQKELLKQEIERQFAAMDLSQPIPPLHDVKIRLVRDESRICIAAIPPEEFGISQRHNCVSIQDTPFCYHRSKKTISTLREMGITEDVIDQIGGGDDDIMDYSPEVLARDRRLDEQMNIGLNPDGSMREVWVTDAYMRIDWDGDGIAELRHVIKAGDAIWINEECSHIPFAAITPIIMPHRWIGKSVAELVMADQFTKSVIWRQILNNLYLTNNPRKAVLSTASGIVQANLDDLMDTRAGGIMREYVQGAIRNEETPFVAGQSFPMLEYIDAQKEVRTGQSRYNQGTDADSLNKTARGIQMIQQAGQQRTDLIARIFAETGVKDLMRGIAYMLSKYSTKAMTLRLRNDWVEIDPREWKTQFDMTVNVGLGTGNKDVQLAHLHAMGEKQMQLIQIGKGYMVTDENLYNLYRKTGEAMGFKHPTLFISDPKTVKAPPPAPNPDIIKIQAEKDTDDKKIQSAQQIRLFDAQTQKELEQIKSQTQIALAQMTAETQKAIADMKIRAEYELETFRHNKTLVNEAQSLQEKERELNVERALIEVNQEASAAKMKAAIDAAVLDVKNIVAQYENKMNAAINSAQTKSAQSAQKKNGAAQPEAQAASIDIAALQKMHQELLAQIGTIVSGISAMSGRKSISVTLPGGETASAEVVTH